MGTNTGLGIGIGIPFKNNALGGDKPYFPPELKARMIGVWTNYGKKNTDADRNIIKNKIPNAGGDLEILNAAYEGMSGCNGYPVIFGINKTWKNVPTYNSIYNINDNKIHFTKILFTNRGLIFSFVKQNDQLYDITEIPSFKIRVSGLKGDSKLRYSYIKTENAVYQSLLDLDNGIHELPKSLAPTDSISNDSWIGFTVTPRIENETSFDCDITIEILPEYEGAFVTDGVDDMIISQKTLQEMGVTKELTIVSMIHQISWRGSASIPLTNYIRNGDTFIRNSISNIGKTGIYGYTCFNIKNVNSSASKVINNILGDKNDYIVEYRGDILSERFSVQGYIDGNGNIRETSSVAHYWTFAVLGKATEDEINLIIGNYNLDRSLKPDILCNIGKQGITNDNHADFNDKLVDYSGNGRDVQMNNLAWKGGSGIAAKPYETFKDWTSESSSTSIITQIDEFTRIVESTTNGYWVSGIRRNSDLNKVYDAINVYLYQDNNFLVHECKYEVDGIKHSIPINESVGKGYHKLEMYTKDRYTELPENAENIVLSEWYFPKSTKGSIKYSIIPSYKGGILLDGINDFGKVTRMPIYKDYTFIIDREIISIGNTNGIVASKSEDSTDVNKQGAFLFEYLGAPNNISAWSFYKDNGKVANTDFTRGISYQSKYSYNGIELLAGTALDSDKLWLGILRDRDSRFTNVAIYSLMSFPYSMSKFLIERQLKKHKLGTFYPNMVEFRPVIKANANYKITYYQIDSTNTWKLIKVGDYIVIGAKLAFQITFDNDASELKEVVSPQLSGIIVEKRPSNPGYNIYSYITSKSPQKINITIDEYIRFEDIVQPYPVLLRFKDESGKEVSWGGKFRVGSTITRIGSAADSNLLPNIYNIFGLLLNGNQITSSKVIVEKTMVFKPKSAYIFDNNEPKCILSPRLLRIPNSSYKLLGYIPDISGHGNHGKINNSAYEGMSGANGYPVVFGKNKTWTNESNGYVTSITSNTIHITNVLNAGLALLYSYVKYNGNLQNIKEIPPFKIEIKGLEGRSKFIYKYLATSDATKETNLYLGNGTHELPKSFLPTEALINNAVVGFSISSIEEGVTNFLSDITIKVLSEYEGAYCLDGVDDFVTIPTTVGGKQVLMKVNWNSLNHVLYDQRNNAEAPFCIVAASGTIAYNQRNVGGNTYIDGILNNHILVDDLQAITHNIVLNNDYNVANSNSFIGTNYTKSIYAKMSLYDFMLFDNISTDDKIKELNEYVGIEAKVELPPYYWDTYGKTNLDADKATIQQRGVAIGDYDLTNYNHVYEGMSGYNGYPVVFGANKTWEILSSVYSYISDVTSTTIHVTMVKNAGTGLLFSYVKKDEALTNIKEIPAFRVTIKGLEGNSKFGYRYLATEDATGETLVYLGNGTHELAKSFAPTEALLDLTRNAWIGIFITPMVEGEVVFDCDITIEVLPEYENGLAYDGVSDFTDNKNIPILTDFTFIIKREILGLETNEPMLVIKGDKVYNNGIGNAFILEHNSNGVNYVYSYGKLNWIKRDDSKIIYLTPESYNGNPIIKGENEDNLGLILGKYWKGIIYKTILYSKTISLLEINFLKNLMEKDEIIDLTNPIFIKDE